MIRRQTNENAQRFLLTLRALPGGVPAAVRLRRALKTLLRCYGLRCIGIRPALEKGSCDD